METNERPLVKSVPGFPDSVAGFPMLAGWSPNGKWIAFTVLPAHGNADLRSNLYVVPAAGGPLRQLGQGAFALSTPAWSVDSQSIYASRSNGLGDPSSQLVRIDQRTDKTTQLASDGMWPQPSRNGKFLYFFSHPRWMLSRIVIATGEELDFWEVRDNFLLDYAVADRYVYLFQPPTRNSVTETHVLIRFDSERHELSAIGEVPFRPRSAQLSPDQRLLYLGQQDNAKQRVVVVHGL
jgi:dipeptidyl aminopeptidase/acylaminoacyl peptidase